MKDILKQIIPGKMRKDNPKYELCPKDQILLNLFNKTRVYQDIYPDDKELRKYRDQAANILKIETGSEPAEKK